MLGLALAIPGLALHGYALGHFWLRKIIHCCEKPFNSHLEKDYCCPPAHDSSQDSQQSLNNQSVGGSCSWMPQAGIESDTGHRMPPRTGNLALGGWVSGWVGGWVAMDATG